MSEADSGNRIILTPGQLRDIIVSAQQAAIPEWIRQVGRDGRALLMNPTNAVLTIVIGFVWDRFVFPIFESIAIAGGILVDSTLVLFLGSDKVLSSVGSPGLADISLHAFRILTTSGQAFATSAFGTLRAINMEILTATQSFGLLGPPAITAMLLLEIGIGLYVGWYLLRTLLQILQVEGVAFAVTKPVGDFGRLLLGVIR